MKLLDAIRARRSVRHYRPGAVPREIIERCIEAARLAPSACNSQPWSFIIVDDPARCRTLAERAFSGIYSMNRFACTAPVLVAVVRERSRYAARLGGRLRRVDYSLIDVGIACEHFVLQAAAEQVGTCWLGWFNEKAVKRVLGLPRRAKVDILLSMGYAADPGSDREPARKDVNAIRRYDA